MNKKITMFASALAIAMIAVVTGTQIVDSIDHNNLDRNCMTAIQSKSVATFHKIPNYAPENYNLNCVSITEPSVVSMILTSSDQVPDGWQTGGYAKIDTITISQIDEKQILGEERFSEGLSAKQRISDDIKSIKEQNPRLNPVYLEIDGLSAFATHGCDDCGKQTATFSDGEVLENSFSMPNRLKIIDDSGLKTVLEGYVSVDELVKIAKSLQ